MSGFCAVRGGYIGCYRGSGFVDFTGLMVTRYIGPKGTIVKGCKRSAFWEELGEVCFGPRSETLLTASVDCRCVCVFCSEGGGDWTIYASLACV